jgi:phosphoglycolate phosphatase-like HAD superfamily hydrolase
MARIVLFDIDGTLVLTGGAGSRAMNLAFEDVFRVAAGFEGIAMHGRTDRGLLQDALDRAGIRLGDGLAGRFRDRYFERLLETIQEPGPRKGPMPGVRDLLDALAPRRDVFLALLTGNYERAARIKLEHFDLWRYFRCGAYGDEVTDRTDLFPVALARAFACGAPRVPVSDVLVVGDTVLDVACAARSGARSVAVATGPSDADTLRQSGADVVFDDLHDTAAFLTLLD